MEEFMALPDKTIKLCSCNGTVPLDARALGAALKSAPGEMGVDSFQADRSPTHMYRTAPLAGLWTHQKGGFYHDGRFATLPGVIEHYDRNFRLGLTDQEEVELVPTLIGQSW